MGIKNVKRDREMDANPFWHDACHQIPCGNPSVLMSCLEINPTET